MMAVRSLARFSKTVAWIERGGSLLDPAANKASRRGGSEDRIVKELRADREHVADIVGLRVERERRPNMAAGRRQKMAETAVGKKRRHLHHRGAPQPFGESRATFPDDQSDTPGSKQRLSADDHVRLEAFGVDLENEPPRRLLAHVGERAVERHHRNPFRKRARRRRKPNAADAVTHRG